MVKHIILFFFVVLFSGCASHRSVIQESEFPGIGELEFAVKMYPENPLARIQLGKTYVEHNKLRLAIAQFDSALSYAPQSSQALYEKGRVLRMLGYEDEGMRLIFQAMHLPDGEQYVEKMGRELGQPYFISPMMRIDADCAFAVWSVDGGGLFFQSNRGANWDIYFYDLTTERTIRLTTDYARDEGPAVHPNGELLAFTSTRNAKNTRKVSEMQRELYLKALKDIEPRRMTFTHSDDWHPVFTRDGDAILYVSTSDEQPGASRICTLDLATKKSSPLSGIPINSYSPALSTDGSFLAFITDTRDGPVLQEFTFADSTATKLTDNFKALSCPHYSPDGTMIAFAGKDGEFFDIYLYIKKEDIIVQLTNDEAMAGQPQFSPDGEKIVYHSNKSGTFQLYKIDLGKPVTIEEIQHLFNSNMK